jgi:predicted acetyltransferase
LRAPASPASTETALSETLHYRFARADEIASLARLVAHSFPSHTPGWWEAQLRDPSYGGGPDTLFVGEDAGRPVAALQLHPLRQWVGGEALSVAGVGSVAISPTHRKRGLGAELMAAALRAAHARGDVASALYPFRTSFYKKLGYGPAGEVLAFQVAPGAIPDSAERLKVTLLESETERAEARALYGSWARGQTGQLERTAGMWREILEPSESPARSLVGYRAAGGALEGYAAVVYRTNLPRPQRYLEVDEIVWTSMAARRGLYGWLASLGDQWQQILMRALPSQLLGDWILEPRLPFGSAPQWGLWEPAATLLFGPMFRLLNLPAAWGQRRIPDAPPISVGLEVTDGQIQENRGQWRLVLANGLAALDRNSSKAMATLRLDISTLSRLYIGSLSPSEGMQAQLIECDRPEVLSALDAALDLPEPWMFDRF